jgi:hypothetical protein
VTVKVPDAQAAHALEKDGFTCKAG